MRVEGCYPTSNAPMLHFFLDSRALFRQVLLRICNKCNDTSDSIAYWDWATLGNGVRYDSCVNTFNLDYGDDDKDFETLLGMKGTKNNLVAFCSGLKLNRSV